MPVPFVAGFTRLTASGVINDAGKPQWVSAYTFEGGAAAAKPYFLNGQDTTSAATIVMRGAGAVVNSSSPVQRLGAWPVAFSNGCYVSFDANTVAVTVFAVQAIT